MLAVLDVVQFPFIEPYIAWNAPNTVVSRCRDYNALNVTCLMSEEKD